MLGDVFVPLKSESLPSLGRAAVAGNHDRFLRREALVPIGKGGTGRNKVIKDDGVIRSRIAIENGGRIGNVGMIG